MNWVELCISHGDPLAWTRGKPMNQAPNFILFGLLVEVTWGGWNGEGRVLSPKLSTEQVPRGKEIPKRKDFHFPSKCKCPSLFCELSLYVDSPSRHFSKVLGQSCS